MTACGLWTRHTRRSACVSISRSLLNYMGLRLEHVLYTSRRSQKSRIHTTRALGIETARLSARAAFSGLLSASPSACSLFGLRLSPTLNP